MKARFLALAALVLGLASCQTEPEGLDVNVGGAVDTTITVSIPETETRANSAVGAFANEILDGELTMRYIMKIYDQNNRPSDATYVTYSDEANVAFDVRLVPNRHYKFVVWADVVEEQGKVDGVYSAEDDIYYKTNNGDNGTIDLRNITIIDSKWNAMNEERDAFTGVYNTEVEDDKSAYTGSKPINITLTRPFAKLRVVTTDMVELRNLNINPAYATVQYDTEYRSAFDALAGKAKDAGSDKKAHTTVFAIKDYTDFANDLVKKDTHKVLFTDYFFANEGDAVSFVLNVYEDAAGQNLIKSNDFNTDIAVNRNYLTTIQGNVLTDGNNIEVKVEDAFENSQNPNDKPYYNEIVEVNNASELKEALEAVNSSTTNEETIIVLGDNINLNDLFAQTQAMTRASSTDPSLTIAAGKSLTLDLNSKTLSATSSQTGKNYNMFDVRGTLTVQNGTIEYEHKGENMGWGASTNIFHVEGGVLNLNGVTAKNLGGSDMGFVAHLNNWSDYDLTLNVENSTLESNYVAVRVFNSGPRMNNVTIKNSTLKGGSNAFWVHNYTVEDFGSEATAKAQQELLNLDIFDESNTFSPILGIRFGFTNSLRFDSYGITRSEKDGVVTLGKLFGNGVVRRGVAGTENNEIITKVVVEEGITELPNRTFYRYKALETVELPSTLTVLGANGDNYYSNGNVFQGCAALKNIVIPESVTTMGPGVFYGCSSLESINIPAGVTRIEKDALRETGLKKVEFHENVTYFGDMAFRDSENLEEIVIKSPKFTIEKNTFENASAPYPVYTIHVANAEMKSYVESMLTANNKKHITVKAPVAVTDKASLQAAMAEAIKAGEKNIYIDGTNFSGDLNYGFSNANLPAGVTVTIRNAKVTATSKWNYLNGKLVFENCEFTAGLYSIHFDDDDGVGDVVFKNCKLVGWLPFAAINSVTFEGCHLTGNGSYALIRSYADLTLKNCVIDTTLANHTDEYTDGVQVINATLTEENVTYIDNHTAYLQNVLKDGKHVVLSNDLTIYDNEGITAPYGNKMALSQKGGVFDGNDKTITSNILGDSYIYMTNGGTTKNLNVTGAFRGIMIMSANQTVYLDNVVSGGKGVVYALNTGEGDSTQDLIATNCTFNGWCSWSLMKSVTFTNCTFGQGSEYTNVTGRIGRPYVNTLYDGCDFCSKYYIDLSALEADQKVTVKNCTVNGVKITAENWTSLVAPEDTCGEGQISVELKNGTFLTAENVADYIVFE